MDGVGGGIAVGEHQTAGFVPLPPVLLVAGVAIHGVESGGGVTVNGMGVCAEFTAQVHPDQRGAGFGILGEAQLLEGMVFVFKPLGEELELGRLAGAVGTLDND